MTRAAVLAATAAFAGVLGAWECLATAEGVRVTERVAAALAPLARARHEGSAPSRHERRRLAGRAAGSPPAGGGGGRGGPPGGGPPPPPPPPAPPRAAAAPRPR